MSSANPQQAHNYSKSPKAVFYNSNNSRLTQKIITPKGSVSNRSSRQQRDQILPNGFQSKRYIQYHSGNRFEQCSPQYQRKEKVDLLMQENSILRSTIVHLEQQILIKDMKLGKEVQINQSLNLHLREVQIIQRQLREQNFLQRRQLDKAIIQNQLRHNKAENTIRTLKKQLDQEYFKNSSLIRQKNKLISKIPQLWISSTTESPKRKLEAFQQQLSILRNQNLQLRTLCTLRQTELEQAKSDLKNLQNKYSKDKKLQQSGSQQQNMEEATQYTSSFKQAQQPKQNVERESTEIYAATRGSVRTQQQQEDHKQDIVLEQSNLEKMEKHQKHNGNAPVANKFNQIEKIKHHYNIPQHQTQEPAIVINLVSRRSIENFKNPQVDKEYDDHSRLRSFLQSLESKVYSSQASCAQILRPMKQEPKLGIDGRQYFSNHETQSINRKLDYCNSEKKYQKHLAMERHPQQYSDQYPIKLINEHYYMSDNCSCQEAAEIKVGVSPSSLNRLKSDDEYYRSYKRCQEKQFDTCPGVEEIEKDDIKISKSKYQIKNTILHKPPQQQSKVETPIKQLLSPKHLSSPKSLATTPKGYYVTPSNYSHVETLTQKIKKIRETNNQLRKSNKSTNDLNNLLPVSKFIVNRSNEQLQDLGIIKCKKNRSVSYALLGQQGNMIGGKLRYNKRFESTSPELNTRRFINQINFEIAEEDD